MKNIIAAIDFSDCSVNALEQAILLGRHGQLDVHMVWVNNPRITRVTIYSEAASDLVDEVNAQFQKLIAKYKDQLPGNVIDYVIREGKVYREIIDEAKEMESLCIVIGTHGISGFEQFWIGSNANRLISVSPVPVITLRAGYKIKKDLDKIILPIDSTLDTRQKVPFTSFLANIFGAEVHVLSLYTTKIATIKQRVDDYSSQVIKFLDEENVKWQHKAIYVDNITTATIEYAKEVDASLISIMTEQETSPINLLIGPYAQQMVHNSPFPVLSINPKQTVFTAID
jgi:nucleotide-binding universal stress UspA family protein